ncbi:MAG: CHC2 zinc finger domain-containing protein, partial [Candidatus Omnitrophota bacterium]
MGLIAEDIIRQVMDRADIIDVIGRYVTVKKYGSNFKALCPFHHEKTPSFVVNPDKQIFHCFGCGVGGNVVGFVMRQERLEFPQAVRFLAEQVGIEIPDNQEETSSSSKNLKDEVYKINQWALDFFHETLLKSRDTSTIAARQYLKGRGVDLETVKSFKIGYAPDEWEALLGVLK